MKFNNKKKKTQLEQRAKDVIRQFTREWPISTEKDTQHQSLIREMRMQARMAYREKPTIMAKIENAEKRDKNEQVIKRKYQPYQILVTTWSTWDSRMQLNGRVTVEVWLCHSD